MGTESVNGLLENGVGVHLPEIHLDDMKPATFKAYNKFQTTATTHKVQTTDSKKVPANSALENGCMASSAMENGNRQPFIIGVAGGAAAGKPAVCDMIIEQLHDQRIVVVNQESFYYDLTEEEMNHVHEYNFDHPVRVDIFKANLVIEDTS